MKQNGRILNLRHGFKPVCLTKGRCLPVMVGLSLLFLQSPSAIASSTIFGAGSFYSGGTATMNALRASGYTTVMLWTIHVDASTGNLVYNAPLICSNGVYVGPSTWPRVTPAAALWFSALTASLTVP
jgi:hypothetical protein